MAELMQFTQNTNDPPKLTRTFINQKKNLDVANLKKRKLFVGAAEDLGLPASKHKCCEAIADSEHDLQPVEGLDEDEYTSMKEGSDGVSEHGSNSFPGDTLSADSDMKVDPRVGNSNSCVDASTSWAVSESDKSQSGSFQVGSSIKDGEDIVEEEQTFQHDTSWYDVDCLEASISSQNSKDTSIQTSEEFDEFLSTSGVDPNLFPLQAERLRLKQETPPEKHKPTIDQEFEEYFSMLML